MNVLVVTPAPPRARTGNRVTALRWAALLRTLGHHVEIGARWGTARRPPELCIALHARRSAEAVDAAGAAGVPVVVALTGTDLYEDLPRGDPAALRSIEHAWRLVGLQPLAAQALPPAARAKLRVLMQSARPSRRRLRVDADGLPTNAAAAARRHFDVCVLAHLRAVKDPLRVAHAARLLSPASRLRVVHVGGAIEPALAEAARAEERANPRYLWLGERPRSVALGVLAGADLCVCASLLEGGANAVGEAVVCGVPVLASRVPGLVGVLGEGHPGYFEAGDTAGLAALLARAERDADFLAALGAAGAARRALFDPERERAGWGALLDELVAERASAAERIRIVVTGASEPARAREEMAQAVRAGLTAPSKRLDWRYFYDAEGSRLFEQICEQPEYYPPRAERAILEAHAGAIVGAAAHGAALCELGSGSAHKTRLLLAAALAREPASLYAPLDISPAALEASARALGASHPTLRILGIVGEYERALPELWRRVPPPRLVLWLGSNIGNFDRAAAARFLGALGRSMDPRDRLLVGIDLRKSRATLERAYDDAAGVTARFNLNLLARINRELGGELDLDGFVHRASYDERDGRIDMHLVSRREQSARIAAAGIEVRFAEGERIHTEVSYKYDGVEIAALAEAARLEIVQAFRDDEARFTDVLLRVKT